MSIASPPRVQASRPAIDPDVARRQLEEQLRLTRQRAVQQRAATLICQSLLLAALALGAIAVADYFSEIATLWRALALLAVFTGTLAIALESWKEKVSS